MKDKIREAFEEVFDVPDYLDFDGEAYMYYGSDPILKEQWQHTHGQFIGFSKGYNSANPLPTTKVCPECKDGRITECDETEAKIKNLTEILVECKELFDVTFVGDSQCRLRVKLIEALKEGYKHEI